jgi:hypothetical protein
VKGRVRNVILQGTHANRWVARRSRRQPVRGVITRVGPAGSAVYKTYALTLDPAERLLLRDATSLEVAFALLLAHHTRALSTGTETGVRGSEPVSITAS